MKRLVILGSAGLLLLAACTGDKASDVAFRPTLKWVDCPSDVEIFMLTHHRCGYLTVLQNRSRPQGTMIRLFVTEAYPAGEVPPATHVGSGFDTDLGRETSIGDTGSGATRVESIVYSLSLRGLGRSEPSLACPEVDELDSRAAASLSDDPELLADFLDAVGACRERLVAEGVDPADYDVQAIAQDMEDLRVALGIEQWYFLNSYGTNARYLFEYLRAFPERVRAAWLDSPQYPQVDEVSGGIGGTRYALRELFRTCAADTACSEAYPDLEALWTEALAQLDRAPLHGFVRDPSAGRVEVTVDAAKLLRMARFTLGGDGPQNLERLPAMISAAAEGRLSKDLASIVAGDRLFCAGYHPLCPPQEGFSLGNYLTVLCRDEAPFIDPVAIATQTAGDPAYEQVFAHDPYVAACEVWDVPPADPIVHEPVTTNVPLLILPGQFDSFSPPPVSDSAAQTLSGAWVMRIPGQTHNTLGFNDCPIAIRNDWIRDPTSPPDTTCLKGMPSVPFATGGMSS